MLAALGAAASMIVFATIVLTIFTERDGTPSSSTSSAPMSRAPAVTSPGGLPDLSQMTPREAADRLFNRVMMASEQGDRVEALRFAPMAIDAYNRLAVLDRDARYHLGLIYNVAGDRANVERQIAAMREGAPDHLLALVLEHFNAEQSDDRAAVSRILAVFTAAYDAEIAKRRPEYDAHRNMIERLRGAAGSATGAAQ